jgi:hypothetical protein
VAEPLTHAGYLSTKEKLANMERRLAAFRVRTDLHATHRAEVERSYLDMMRQYLRELKLYEATHSTAATAQESEGGGRCSDPARRHAMSVTTTEPTPRNVAEYPLSHGKLILSLEGTTPTWAEPTLRALGRLLHLLPGWDSHRARPIDLAVAWAVVPLLNEVMRDETPPPAVVPTNRGGVQLEWHEKGIDLEVELIDARRVVVSFEDAHTGETWEKELTSDMRELTDCVARLSARDPR